MKQDKIDKLITKILLTLALILCAYHLYNATMIQGYSKAKITKEYILAAEMFLGAIVVFVPNILNKLLKLEMPSTLKRFFWLFIFFAIFIGTGLGFYDLIKHWDKLLHFSSAMLLTSLGFAIMGFFINKDLCRQINPLFFALFAFGFAVALGVFWEFHEFTFDSLLNLNMQRYQLPNKELLCGQAALYDTISDLITNTVGALLYTIYAYYKIKKDSAWLCDNSLIKCN